MAKRRRETEETASGAGREPGGEPPSSHAVIEAVRRQGKVTSRDLARRLGVPAERVEAFAQDLFALADHGHLVRIPHGRGGAWELPQRASYRLGRLEIDRKGRGFVTPAVEGEDNVFVPPAQLYGALAGDKVLLRLVAPARAGRLREGRVVEVIERGRRLVRGTYWKRDGGGVLEPDDPRVPQDIVLSPQAAGSLADGDRAVVRVLQEARRGRPQGEVVIVLHDEGSLASDVEVIRAEFELPGGHGGRALEEADALPPVPQGIEWPDRKDLRRLVTFTVDPIDARDFDDAISLERLPGNRLRLGVHIADVSHYVRPGSALDRAAEERGTSVYLPGEVIPMLPERLSNDLASLRPGEDRLAKSVLMTFGSRGGLREVELVRSVVRSRRRFTYTEVQAIFNALSGAEESRALLPADHEEFEPVLRALARLCERLRQARERRGALFLEIPALKLKTGPTGEILGIGREERDAAHGLIEEFMLAANEAVARAMVERSLPLVGRVHSPPDPEKLEEFRTLVEAVGLKLQGGAEARDFQTLVDEVAGTPLSASVQLALLRTMEHAQYVPGVGLHFALATSHYCHFTSPIRRYPDLIVHQILEEHLESRRSGRELPAARIQYWKERAETVAEPSSALERRAEEAERAMHRLRLIRYLEPRLGEEMVGWIVSVHPFGFFVRIEGLLVEGLVHVATLDGYYEFDKEAQALRPRRAGRARRADSRSRLRAAADEDAYRLGARVRVVLYGLDPVAREITFRLAAPGGGPA